MVTYFVPANGARWGASLGKLVEVNIGGVWAHTGTEIGVGIWTT